MSGPQNFLDRLPDKLRQDLNDAVRHKRLHMLELIAGLEELLTAPEGRAEVGAAAHTARLEKALVHVRATREVADRWAREIGEVPDGDIGRLVNHLLSALASDLSGWLTAGQTKEPATPSVLRALTSALRDLESAAKINAERALKLREQTAQEAAKAATTVARAKGLSADAVREIERKILGVARASGAAVEAGALPPPHASTGSA